jgi:hypothetical protein
MAPQGIGPDTARKLARYAMSASRLAPDVYNPASAMDQVLEQIRPGLSQTVTSKAGAMMLKGVQPQAALEEALTEAFVALRPRGALSGLGGLGTTTTTTRTTTTISAAEAARRNQQARTDRLSAAGGLVSDIGGAVTGLIEGITGAVTGVQEQRRLRDQQNFEQRMAQAQADQRAAEDAAIRDATALPRVGGARGIGLGTILLGALGLAAAGGAIYFMTKKK